MSTRSILLSACLSVLFLPAAQTLSLYSVPYAGSSRADSDLQDLQHSLGPEANTQALQEEKGKLLTAVYGVADEDSAFVPDTLAQGTLWLARAIYSETKRPHEQELVAWVVRNRVETHYRGQRTYKDVVLDPYQFSAFNPDAPKRLFYMNLTPDTQLPGWQEALWIAKYVRHANAIHRPFPIKTRHFFSEQSMKKQRHPYWADRQKFVQPGLRVEIKKKRFRFYEGIS